MKCVAVRKGKNKQFSKMVKHETIFKGLIKCKNCGCTVTPDPKKGKYIYLKPNRKKGCNCRQINENVANDVVAEVLKSICISTDTLEQYVDSLKNKFNQQTKENLSVLSTLNKKLDNIKSKLSRLNDIYLDEDISKEEYSSIKKDLQTEQVVLEQRIKSVPQNSDEVIITLECLSDVISRLYFIYQSSRIDTKRKILNLVFSNFWLNGSTLSYEIKKPFDMFIKGAYRLKNWVWWDSNPRPID